jgi:lysophospholipase L1-like esterase
MPLGDSLTSYLESYRGPLYRELKAIGWNIDFVGSGIAEPVGGGDSEHEGHGGYRIGPDDLLDWEGNKANLADRVDAWIAASAPEVIVLNIGTNDIAAGGDVAKQAPQQLMRLIATLRALAPKAQIVVGDLPPNGWVREGTAESRLVSTAAKQVAEQSPDYVQYVPINDRMRANGFDPTSGVGTIDNTHFTVSGGVMFATAMQPEVIEALQRVRRC